MSHPPVSDEVALRIALAARALPGVTIPDLVEALQNNLGETIDEAALSRITVTNLKTAVGQTYDLDGEEDGEDNRFSLAALKEAVRILWGESEANSPILGIEPYQEGSMPNSIRVAVASNQGELLDGHFGSCLRYLIYQLSPTEMQLIDVRSAAEAEASGDKNGFRVNLLQDCSVLYIVSVGGPAAAKVIRAGIYPMKVPEGGEARAVLRELQRVMVTSPPPWLAKILGVAAGDRVKNYKAVEVG